MPCASLQRKLPKFQEESSDLETQLLELGFLCENSDVANPDSLLEPETFTTVTAYDALNRATSIRTPHNAGIPASEILPAYNEASLLESVDVKLRGSGTATNFVRNIDYDAKGQRERIQYGNGSTTGYTYDEKTFQLKRLLTTRNNGADILQDLNYTYDAAGNVTQIDDNAQQTIFFNGSVVSPSQKFEYDALYRLVKATGREHASVNADGEPEADGYNAAQISPQDGSAMRNYAREWRYDSVGNILSIIHQANGNAWTRTNAYAADSNRLIGTTVGSTSASFSYNAHGSMASMPHLSAMDWDFAEKLSHITRGTTEAYYSYDGNGIRTRKVVEKNGVVETRLYLGGFEIWRKTVNGTLETERETLYVMDDQKRIAIVETLTVENGNRIASPAPVLRYQLDNHLGSASLELDGSANIISYEEYYPYGDTSYRAGRSASEVNQKRYRYTGKEKDEESSLYYCEQRYYAAHISRWVSTDPTWLEDGINLYAYVNGNPVSGADPHGTNEENVVDQEQRNVNQVSISKKNRDSDEEKNIPTDGPHSISDEMIQIINKVGWYGGGAVCFDLAVAAAETAASLKYTDVHVGRAKDKGGNTIGNIWQGAPKKLPKDYSNLSIRKVVAKNMSSYIKASIDKGLPVVVGVSIGEIAKDKNGKLINDYGVTGHFLVLTSYDAKDGKVVGFSGFDNSSPIPSSVHFDVNEKTGAIEKPLPTINRGSYVDKHKYTVTQVRLWKGVKGLMPKSPKGVY